MQRISFQITEALNKRANTLKSLKFLSVNNSVILAAGLLSRKKKFTPDLKDDKAGPVQVSLRVNDGFGSTLKNAGCYRNLFVRGIAYLEDCMLKDMEKIKEKIN